MRRRRVLNLVLATSLVIFLVSCAGWQKKSTAAYEAVGELGASYYQVAKSNCDSAAFTSAQCATLKDVNNKARKVYIQAGDTLKLAINTEDAVKQQTILSQYNSLMAEFNKVLAGFLATINEFKKGGTK